MLIKTIKLKFFLLFIACIIIPWLVISIFVTNAYTNDLQEKYMKDLVNSLTQSVSAVNHKFEIAQRYLDIIFSSETLNSQLSQVQQVEYDSSYRRQIMNIDSFMNSITGNDDFIAGSAVMVQGRVLSTQKMPYWGDSPQSSAFYEAVCAANGAVVRQRGIMISDEYGIEHEYILLGRQIKKIVSTSYGSNIENENMGAVCLFISAEKVLKSLKPALSSGEMLVALQSNTELLCADISPKLLPELEQAYQQASHKKDFSVSNGHYTLSMNTEESIVLYSKNQNLSYTAYGIVPGQMAYSSMSYIRSLAILVQVFCGAAFLIFSMIFRNIIAKPIQKIESAMENVTRGNLNIVVNTKTGDEFERMGNSFNFMVTNLQQMIEQIHEDYKIKNEMEISMLQYQINPHFIYNILSSIRLKAMLNKDLLVADMLSRVPRLLSRTIGKSGKDILLSEEIVNVEDFIYIHKKIFNNPINVSIHIAPGVADCIVPNMLLQPIVENCFVHGASADAENFCVFIKADQLDQDLVITVSDDGVGMDDQTIQKILSTDTYLNQDKYNQIGVNSVNKRLKLYYGEAYGLNIQSKLGCFTKVTIRLPLVFREGGT